MTHSGSVSSHYRIPAQSGHYAAPPWLPGAHLQTIWPSACMAAPDPAFQRERWLAPDGDFIDADCIQGQAEQPTVILFHGLEGSSRSHYCRYLAAAVQQAGWSIVIPHFRGCSGDINLLPRLYHSGDSDEVEWIVRKVAASQQTQATPPVHPRPPLFVCGVSLGGNALLRWLGEQGTVARESVQAAFAVSAPLDLAAGGQALSSGFNRLYTAVFLRTMKRKAAAKLAQFPGLFNRDAMLNARTLRDFDNVVTAPLHGYRDTDDYWQRASSLPVLPKITVPTVLLNARNDPFLPATALPVQKQVSECVIMDFPEQGGHVGFAAGAFPGNQRWLASYIMDFFRLQQS